MPSTSAEQFTQLGLAEFVAAFLLADCFFYIFKQHFAVFAAIAVAQPCRGVSDVRWQAFLEEARQVVHVGTFGDKRYQRRICSRW